MTSMTTKVVRAARQGARRFTADEDGATAIEYGLIAALIAVSLVGALTTLADSMSTTFGKSQTAIESVRD